MKFAKKYRLVSANNQRTATSAPLPPQETGIENYERAAAALTENITDRSLPADVSLENHSFLRDNYMQALSRIMRDRNQIVDRLDSIARLISLNAPAGGALAPLAGIRSERETENSVLRERTPPPFEVRGETKRRRLLSTTPSQLENERTPVAKRRRAKKTTEQTPPPIGSKRGGYLRQDKTKLSPLLLKRVGLKDWATKTPRK